MSQAQDSLIAGFNFGQFIGPGYPSTDPDSGEPVGFIGANFKGTSQPATSTAGIYRVNNGISGTYNPGYATWYWDGSNGSSTVDNTGGTEVVVFEKYSVNAVNASTVHSYNMIVADDNFAGLRFAVTNKKWSITLSTLGYSDTATANNLSFAAFATGGPATVEWFINGSGTAFASTNIAAGSDYSQYSVDLPSGFYGIAAASIQGRISSGGAVTFDNVQINGSLAQPPTFTQQPATQTVNAGDNASFTVAVTGAASPTYEWRRNGVALVNGNGVSGANTATLSLTSVNVSRAGNYSVVVNNNGVTAESNVAVLTVQTLPAFTLQPFDVVAAPGGTATFTVAATGIPTPTYAWRKNNVPLADDARVTGSATATLSITDLVEGDEGAYTVVITNPVGPVTSNAANLTVTNNDIAPAVQSPPTSKTVVAGQTVTFSVVASGSPAPTYQWRKNGENLVDGDGVSGATTATLTLTNVGAINEGDYTVVVTNSVDALETAPATLTVQFAPLFTTQPTGATRLVGQSVTFTTAASGVPAPSFQWYKNGEPLSGETGASLTIANVTLASAGVYTVVITNDVTSVTSDPATLVVIAPPAILTQPVGGTVNAGGAFNLSVVATGTPTPTYQWYKDGQPIADADSATLPLSAVQASDAGSYTVLVSVEGADPVLSSAAIVRVTQAVVTTTPKVPQKFAPGSLLSFGQTPLEPNNLTYVWFRDGKVIPGATSSVYVIPQATFTDTGVYSVKIYNSAGKLVATQTVARVIISVAGSYDALLREPVTLKPVGRFETVVADNGAFTGRLLFQDGGSYPLKGKLVLDGTGFRVETEPALVIKRGKSIPSLELDLRLDPRDAELDVAVSVSGNTDPVAVGMGVSRITTAAPWTGTYTLTLAPTTPPAAINIAGAAKIDSKGKLGVSGKTTDGKAFTASVAAGADATYALFMPLYGKLGGFLAGELALEQNGLSYRATPQTSGQFLWRKPSGVSGSMPGPFEYFYDPTLAP